MVILDLRELVGFCDYFVLCNGASRRQVQAIARSVVRVLKGDDEVTSLSVEGMDSSRWVLADFGDVVLHVFDNESRGFYDLDSLWADAPRIAPAAAPAADDAADTAQVPASA